MMPRKPDKDGYFQAANALYFNIRCCGGILFSRVTSKHFRELQAASIEWAWCVQEKRELTKKEIAKFCARGTK